MGIITRYILREFGKNLSVALSAFVILFLLGDFIEKVDDYIEHKAAVMDVVGFTLYQLPKVLFLMTPVAVLLATLLTLGTMSRNSEVIAMKSSGIPLYRIVMPIFAVAVALSAVIFWANESVIPYCNAKAEYVMNVRIKKKPAAPALMHNKLWFRGPNGEIINLGLVELGGKTPTCMGVTFFRLDDAFRLVERIDVERMEWVDEGWTLKNGKVYSFDETGGIKTSTFATRRSDLPEKPEDFKGIERISEEMTFSELKKYITRLKEKGYNPLKYVVDLHAKTSFTFANLIMVIVAVPFSLRGSRSGGMALGVGVCIVIAISYWLIYSFSISLGHAGRFPPLFSAWVANLVFGFGGLYMYLHTDR